MRSVDEYTGRPLLTLPPISPLRARAAAVAIALLLAPATSYAETRWVTPTLPSAPGALPRQTAAALTDTLPTAGPFMAALAATRAPLLAEVASADDLPTMLALPSVQAVQAVQATPHATPRWMSSAAPPLSSPDSTPTAPASTAAAETSTCDQPAPNHPGANANANASTEPNMSAAAAQAHFDRLGPQCLRSAPYYRQYGQWLLRQGNATAAVEALERALLLEPQHLGTQLDYAQALIVVGDVNAAAALLGNLQREPSVPSHVVPLLAGQLQALQSLQVASATPTGTQPIADQTLLQGVAQGIAQGMVHRTMVSQSVGWDDNLNNAASATDVILTYPDADLSLPLADASRPQPGGTATTAAQWTGLLPQGRALWVLQAKGQMRHTASSASRYQQAEVDVTWLQAPAAARQWIARAEHSSFRWGGRKLYTSEKLGLQHQWVRSAGDVVCRTAVGAEVENRTFPGSRNMNGLYRGAIASLVCQQQGSISLQLRSGLDQPDLADRVGGTQHQTEARMQWLFSAGGTQWQTEYSYQRQRDTTGYSPLLSRNAIRSVTRHALRLEASRPMQWSAMGNPQWFGSIEVSHQNSSLELFASNRRAVQTGMRWVWQ